MPVATKKRPPMESEPGEGKSHEMKESPEDEIREGSESEEGEYLAKRGRKRTARGAKRTKAPMDGEGCACGGKGRKGKAACDGDCGMKKRSDALTAPEYLAACDLGIQDMPRPYIRARLDTAQRLDLKCGKGSISKGEKCHKGPATQVREFAEKVAPAALGLGVAAGLIALRRRGRTNAQRTREVPSVPSNPPAPPRSPISRPMQESRRRRYTGSSQRRSAPTLEQWGQAAQQGPEALGKMMNSSSTNRRTRIKRRSRSGLLQPARRDVYAAGFSIDYDQLTV